MNHYVLKLKKEKEKKTNLAIRTVRLENTIISYDRCLL